MIDHPRELGENQRRKKQGIKQPRKGQGQGKRGVVGGEEGVGLPGRRELPEKGDAAPQRRASAGRSGVVGNEGENGARRRAIRFLLNGCYNSHIALSFPAFTG